MDNKVTTLHGYNADGTPYVAVPSLADKAVKDGQGNIIADVYATKQEVEQALADIDGSNTGGKTVIPYNSQWSVVEEAINGDGICVVEYSNQQYYYSMNVDNPTLGRKFAWFCTPMNPHSKVNGIQVIQVRYDVAEGRTTWDASSNTQTWLTRADGDSLYADRFEFIELQEKVAALDPTADGTTYNSLPMFSESEEDFNRLTRLPDDMNYIIFVLDPTTFSGADFGKLLVDPNGGEYAVFILWAGEGDPRNVVEVLGTGGEWSQDDGDGSWSYIDTLQGDVPMYFNIGYGGNAFTFTIDVGEGGDEPATTSKIKAVVDLADGNVSDGWSSKQTVLGNEFYMMGIKLGRLGSGWGVPFDDNSVITVSISEQSFWEGVNAGFVGAIGYEKNDNRLIIAASTNATNYKINITAER